MLQDTPGNYLDQINRFPFKLYKVQKFILSQLDDSFKVISLPRKCGVTTAVCLCGIVRAFNGLHTDLISNNKNELLVRTMDIYKMVGAKIGREGYDVEYIHIHSSYVGNYSIFDTPFEECNITGNGIAFDCYGKWKSNNGAKVTWQVI